jgi:hypothetical protein
MGALTQQSLLVLVAVKGDSETTEGRRKREARRSAGAARVVCPMVPLRMRRDPPGVP